MFWSYVGLLDFGSVFLVVALNIRWFIFSRGVSDYLIMSLKSLRLMCKLSIRILVHEKSRD